jgi:Protein of unknown function (DUF2971)
MEVLAVTGTTQMNVESTRSGTLDALVASSPPEYLYHYTSPHGLIGMAKSKEIWATHVAHLNDTKEMLHAADLAKALIERRITLMANADPMLPLLKMMMERAGSAMKRIYIVSFTLQRDLLSQWRAYCPPAGGYAVGFPSSKIAAMSKLQSFLMAPCVYARQTQEAVVGEFIDSFVSDHLAGIRSAEFPVDPIEHTAWRFGQHLGRIGAILKHESFSEEQEWRLISPIIQEPHLQLDFRGSDTLLIPHFRFKLTSDEWPEIGTHGESSARIPTRVIVGPNEQPGTQAQFALEFFLRTHMPGASRGHSAIPYRGR